MDIQHVPAALSERLGHEATADLVHVVNTAGREWKDETMNGAAERFERRLIEETSKLRVEMAQMEARLTGKMADLLKWSFVFWIGQVVAITAIMSVLLRTQS